MFTGILAFLLVMANSLKVLPIPTKVKKLTELLCAMAAVLLITYVGVFLQSIEAVPFWSSLTIPVLFILSSLSTGFALFFLVFSLSSGAAWLKKQIVKASRVNRVVLVLEAVTLILLLWHATFNAAAMRSLNLLFGSELQLWFFVGAVGFGIVIPMLTELYAIAKARILLVPPIYLLSLLGGLCLRYCIVSAGAH
jgi:formate-dependent nitrite reductase membrane component NrfD